MFHYHFRSKENFLRALLQVTYDEMFARLQLTARADLAALENLRAALSVIARFVRDNRRLLLRLIGDAISGEALAADFLRANMPRHLGVIAALMQAAQDDGSLLRLPLGQMLGFVIGAVGMPILASAVFEDGALPDNATLVRLAADTLPDAALAQRIDLALTALGAPGRKRTTRGRRSRA
jgi:AcrR family transcriptional regulator